MEAEYVREDVSKREVTMDGINFPQTTPQPNCLVTAVGETRFELSVESNYKKR